MEPSQIIRTSSRLAGDPPRHEPASRQQHGNAGHGRDQHQEIGDIILSCLHRFVHRNRQRLCLAGYAAGDHQGGAEFARRPRKGQQQSCQNAAPRQRQRHPEKYAGLTDARHAGCLFKLRVDRLEGGARRFEHQREGNDGGGNHCALPGKDQVDVEGLQQPVAQWAIAPQQHEQVIAEHGRRHHHGQGKNGIQQVASGKAAACKQKTETDPQHEVEQGCAPRHLQRQRKRNPGLIHAAQGLPKPYFANTA
jgi:hypothetical protein